jgi:hypothetical protein
VEMPRIEGASARRTYTSLDYPIFCPESRSIDSQNDGLWNRQGTTKPGHARGWSKPGIRPGMSAELRLPKDRRPERLPKSLEWRFHSALFLACDGRLLQIELALDASARLVGNFALAQQPVDEFTFGGNQVRSELRDCGSSFEPI